MYLNSDTLKVKIFIWLTETIEKLKIEEKEWKQNNHIVDEEEKYEAQSIENGSQFDQLSQNDDL